jgi:mannose-6-phosphate isomerase-like protein (cupin superfamily)
MRYFFGVASLFETRCAQGGDVMKRKNLQFETGFRVVLGTRLSQAAEMVLPPGHAEGGPQNRHRTSDQWLYVVSGTGIATVNGRRYSLGEGTLMLIERGDEHEIRNNGDDLLRTLNFYLPPAYDKDGEELRRARN